jgi:hypothetical protein
MISDTSSLSISPPVSPSLYEREGEGYIREAPPLFDSPYATFSKEREVIVS